MGPIMSEIWKAVEGYEGWYQVSNYGRVRSVDREIIYPDGSIKNRKAKVLSGGINKYGYAVVVLSKNGCKKNLRVNRLVAEAFITNTNNAPQVNHRDGDKLNNHSSNLEWVTNRENIRHAVSTGLKRFRTGKLISPSGQVFFTDHIKEFSILNNLNSRHIYEVINGDRYSHKGWTAL